MWVYVITHPSNISVLGMLLNTSVNEVLDSIISLEDISEDDAQYLYSILKTLCDGGVSILSLAQSDAVLLQKVVPKWNKLSEMMFVLKARLSDLVDRWADSKGPLAVEFSSAEMKKLIRALFQNTEKRASVLAAIK